MSKVYELIHHKDFHKLQLQGLRVKERNIFLALSFLAMNQESNLLELDVNDIAYLSNYTPTKAGENIYKYIDETYLALQKITILQNKEDGFKRFTLFTSLETFQKTGKIQFKINDDYRYILNEIVKPYTIQNLFEYNKLSSKYSQLMYSFLKEWEGVKNKTITIEEFKQKFTVPETYRMIDIDTRILNPVMKELPVYFDDLKIKKLKTGKNITHIQFTWQKQSEIESVSQENQSLDEFKKSEIALEKEFDDYCNQYFDNTKLKKAYNIKFAKALYVKYRNNPKIFPSEKQDTDVYSFLFDFDKLEDKS